MENASATEIALKSRVNEFRKMLDGKQILKEFDRGVFESVIEKVIVGGYDEDGNKDPAMLTFIYKSGFENNVNGRDHKPPRRNAKGQGNNDKLSSLSKDEVKDLCSTHEDDTCGECYSADTSVAKWRQLSNTSARAIKTRSVLGTAGRRRWSACCRGRNG